MTETLKAIIPKLAKKRILVLGDVMLDEYVTGRAQRLSREAPIPVLEFESRRYIPGGAANPAANIVALGSEVVQVGIVGDDDTAEHLRRALSERGISGDALVTVAGKPTTLKTRLLAQMGLRFPQQIARVDTLSRQAIGNAVEEQVLAQVRQHIEQVDALLVSDYHNGLLTSDLVNLVQDIARQNNVPLFVDAQGKLQKYRAFDVVKCNADDAAAYLNRNLQTGTDFIEAAKTMLEQLAIKSAMIITRGGDGATLADTDEHQAHCPAPTVRDVYDTVGAGDTWIAVMTLACITGASYEDAVKLANFASGIVVQHVGNYTPSQAELAKALEAL